MTIDMSQFYEVFFDEAEELLAEAERLLLGINIDDPDIEELNAIFRAAHSIKGGAATFGFMDMTEITHVLENLLDKIRKFELALTAEHVDAFLAAKDVLKMMVDGHRHAAPVDQEQVADVKMQLNALSDKSGSPPPAVPVVAQTQPVAEIKTEPVVETPAPAIESSAKAPVEAPTAASVQADANGMKHFAIELPELSDKDTTNLKNELGLLGNVTAAKLANGHHVFTLVTDSTETDIISICSFIVDVDSMVIRAAETAETEVVNDTPVTETPLSNKVEIHEEVGYGLFAMPGGEHSEEGYGFFAPFTPHPDAVATNLIGDDTEPHVLETPNEQSAVAATAATATPSATNAEKKNLGRRESDKAPANAETTSIRVGIEKVDQLINLVGELVITQAMIEQRSSTLDPVLHEKLINSISLLTRNTRDLQESVMSIRMMPMDFVFSRFPRMVRDLAGKLNKKVEFVTVGATTELDKGLIERIVDPLTHLVRNSVDHGIEVPEKRRAAGKNESGKLTLSAAHKGGSIVIEVTDDGGGLNREKYWRKPLLMACRSVKT